MGIYSSTDEYMGQPQRNGSVLELVLYICPGKRVS